MDPPADAKIILRISGENYDRLKEAAAEIEEKMETIEGVTNVRDDIKPETLQFNLALDTEKAAMMGV